MMAVTPGAAQFTDKKKAGAVLSAGNERLALLSIPSEHTVNSLPMLLQLEDDADICNFISCGQTVLVSKEDGSSKRRTAGNGLRQFALFVLKKVQEKGSTTYNEVADELVADMTTVSARSVLKAEEKNIRRRVYDALNVLLALKIIRREKKEILWTGMPATMAEQCARLQKQCFDQKKRIEQKWRELTDLTVQLIAFKSLLARNRMRAVSLSTPDDENVRLHLPFIVVNTSKQTAVDCWLSNDRRAYMFNFDRRFEIHDDVEVLKRMGMAFGLEHGGCSKPDDLNTLLSLIPHSLRRIIVHLTTRAGKKSDSELTAAQNDEDFESIMDEAMDADDAASCEDCDEATSSMLVDTSDDNSSHSATDAVDPGKAAAPTNDALSDPEPDDCTPSDDNAENDDSDEDHSGDDA